MVRCRTVVGVVALALLVTGLPLPSAAASVGNGTPAAAGWTGHALMTSPPAGKSTVSSNFVGAAAALAAPLAAAPGWTGTPSHRGTAVASPRAAVVNVNALYSAEPAPMGVTDFGISGTTGYTYYTSQFLGQARLISTSATGSGGYGGNYVSYQLNVVLSLTHGASTTAYWIQDVPILDTSTHYFFVEDNIWNMSSSPSTIPSTTLSGNGTTYTYSGSNTYYADGASSSYAGNDVTLSYPTNISAKVVSSVIGGLAHVAFQYNDGYGWVTYDNVSFPWSKGWTDHGFEVNGTSYNGYGTFYDAEWVVCGPGSSSNAAWTASNQLFNLEFFNGHNFEPVLNAYNFGSDTAETASNVLESLNSVGAPGAHVATGSGSLASLYTRSNIAIVNVSAPLKAGTLLVNGNATGFVGSDANLTLLPGSYHLVLENGSKVVGARNITVSAGAYLAVTFLSALTLSGTTGPGGATVIANGTFFAPGSTATVLWSASGATLCTATVGSTGAFSCTFTVPATKAGIYRVNASDSASTSDLASAIFTVTTNLAVTASVSESATDVGVNVTYTASATGGDTPYASYNWNFGDGSKASVTSTSTTHSYSTAKTFTATVTVTDNVGNTANGTKSLTVNSDPSAAAPKASPSSVDLGQSTTLNTTASSGTGAFTYAWSGLPSGCSGTTASIRCQPSATGTVNVTVTVTDSVGSSATSAALSFRTYADPSVTTPSANLSSLDVHQKVNLSTVATLGSGGYSYNWTGLPTGCRSTNASLICTPTGSGTFAIRVNVTDSNGGTASSSTLNLTVDPDPTVSTPSSTGPSADVGQSVTFAATATAGSGNLTYVWSNLPTGCSGSGSSVTCRPSGTGTFAVAVTVTDSNGFAIVSAALRFTVYAAPTVGSPASAPGSADVGQTVTFNATASLGSGGYTYLWSGLPTGCSGASDPLSCTVSAAGTFTITLQVTDSNGESSTSSSFSFTVHPDPVVAKPTVSASSADVGQAVTFNASASLGYGGYAYLWSGLPNGCVGSTGSVSCVPTGPGSFVVTVRVTDSEGFAVTSASLTFTVYADPTAGVPVAGPPSLDVGRSGTITVVTTPGSGGLSYTWSGLPTGCVAVGALVTCSALATPGSFSIRVRVNDSNGFAVTSGSLAFTVYADPSVGLVANRTALDLGGSVLLNATATLGSGGYAYTWAGLPPGCSSPEARIACSPSASGTFQVTVTVTDSNGVTVTSATIALAIAPPITASASATPQSPTTGAAVAFDATGAGGTGALVFTWLFGDGSKGIGSSVSHSYASAGRYTATLWVNDSIGGSLMRSVVVVVTAPPAGGGLLGLPPTVIGGGVVLLVVAALVAATLLLRRRRKAGIDSERSAVRPEQSPPAADLPDGQAPGGPEG